MIAALGERAPAFDGDGQFVAASADVVGSVLLGEQCSIWFGAVLRGDNDWIRIAARSNVQDGAILHTDPGLVLDVGRGVTIGHRAVLHGCQVADNCLIGIGSTLLNGAVIEADSLVGAGALVTEGKQFPPRSLILGSPAKVVRTLNDDEVDAIRRSADVYVEKAARYREHFRGLD